MTCDKCGAELRVGEWPYCPHGFGGQTVIPDDVPGGFVVENGFSTPQKFYSKSEHKAALDREGLQLAPRWVPGSKHMTRWIGVDAKTLENAAILVARQKAREAKPVLPEPTEPVRIETSDETFTVEMQR